MYCDANYTNGADVQILRSLKQLELQWVRTCGDESFAIHLIVCRRHLEVCYRFRSPQRPVACGVASDRSNR
jgi:hypothetical protein